VNVKDISGKKDENKQLNPFPNKNEVIELSDSSN